MKTQEENIKMIDDSTRIVFKAHIIMECNFSKYKLQLKKKFLWFYYWKTVEYTYHTIHKSYDEMQKCLIGLHNYKKTSAWKRAKELAFYPSPKELSTHKTQ
jgi:hypothetical protein